MAKKQAVEIVVIADRSGSMGMIKNDAIGGYNQFLSDQKKVKGAANLTLVLFDHEYLVSADSVPINDAKPLDNETYVPRGSTALNDAIGRALNALEAKAPKKAIVCILTDGQENSSHEFTTAQAKDKIAAAEAKGWQVVYLSANASAFADGAAYGIKAANLVQFANTGAGVRTAYSTTSTLSAAYRAS